MKFLFIALAFVALAQPALAKSREPASADLCKAGALTAAEAEYGNDPTKTTVTVVEKGKEYKVAVGKNNPEDGEVDYNVTFPNGCNGQPHVQRIN
jgi:hypothetical protein